MSKFLLSHAGPQKSYLKPNKSLYFGIKEKKYLTFMKNPISISQGDKKDKRNIWDFLNTFLPRNRSVCQYITMYLFDRRTKNSHNKNTICRRKIFDYLSYPPKSYRRPKSWTTCHFFLPHFWMNSSSSCPAFVWLFISDRRMNEENFVVFSFKIFPFHGEHKK